MHVIGALRRLFTAAQGGECLRRDDYAGLEDFDDDFGGAQGWAQR